MAAETKSLPPFVKLLVGALADILTQYRDPLGAKVLTLWDTYGAPYDIPGVGDTFVDPAIRSLLVKVTPGAIDALATKLAAIAK